MSATEGEAIWPAAAGDAQLAWLSAVLDLAPTPLLLIEPATARVLFANQAADRLAGGRFPVGYPAEEYHLVYHATDAAGRRIPNEEMPGVRAARGERLRGFEMDWHTPGGVRSLLISSDTVPALHGRPEVVVIAFDDVTELRRKAEENERLYADAQAAQSRAVEALALLDTLFESAPVGLAFFDSELRYARVNDALAQINGVPARDHIGRTVPEVLPDMDPEVVAAFRRVVETGEPLVDLVFTGETPAQPGETRTWDARLYPVRDGPRTIGVGAVVIETTEMRRVQREREEALAAERVARERAERAERRSRFLGEAGAQLTESLDYEETLKRLARIAVPERADWCVVDMVDDHARIERVAVAHADEGKVALVAAMARRRPARLDDERSLVARVLRTGEPLLLPEIDDDLLAAAAQDEEQLRLLRELGMGSAMAVPLRSRGRVLGVISFVRDQGGGAYDEGDLDVACELAARAAVAIDNARVHTSRDRIAQTLQNSLLPPSLPPVPRLELAARYRPAGEGDEVGGDFYDVFATGDGRWALVIGDVCGKGAEAAALTSLMRYTLRTAAMVEPQPSVVLTRLNDALLRQRSDDRFSTALLLKVAPEGEGVRVTLASGGHPLPLLLRADGGASVVGEPGTLLGVLAEARHRDDTVDLGPGDTLLLYTDGLTDAGAPARTLSEADLLALLESCAGLPAEELARRVEEHAISRQEGLPRDDLALVVARVTPPQT